MALKHNSKKVLDVIAGQKKRNAKAAYQEIHPNASDAVAKMAASKLLAKPEAQVYLQQHADEAQATVIEVMQNARTKKYDHHFQKLALESGNSILDRHYGKATIKTESTSNTVTLNLSLKDVAKLQHKAANQPQ